MKFSFGGQKSGRARQVRDITTRTPMFDYDRNRSEYDFGSSPVFPGEKRPKAPTYREKLIRSRMADRIATNQNESIKHTKGE